MTDDVPDSFNPEPCAFAVGVRPRRKRKRKAVPCLPRPLAIACCVLNVLLPGMGTILAGCLNCCCGSFESQHPRCIVSCTNVYCGLLQMALTPLVVGYVWSVLWGVLFVQLSSKWWVARLEERDVWVERCPCAAF